MSTHGLPHFLWRKVSHLLSQKQNLARKRRLFRSSLIEQFEKREMMAYDISGVRLLNDTGISSTDKITYDPTLTGSVASSGGGMSGFSGGYGGGGILHVQFDHNGDGVGDGSVLVNGTSFQYDPRTTDPGLYFYAGAMNLKLRVRRPLGTLDFELSRHPSQCQR